ncbi:MAG: hypothetical protein US49_C0001G0062 [candidate division TM6 bacterium GW2011_GWF2_37_49]|nr:MAG: hypothetical protein US49_C0001G0062 [candidate division TM6 bacterium GW2011_GWF2_37_49]
MILNLKNCLYSSLTFHLLLCVAASVITNNGGIKKTFVVFGAHSKKNYHTLYKNGNLKKTNRATIPFVGGGKKFGTKSGHGSKSGSRKAKQRTKSVLRKTNNSSKSNIANKAQNFKNAKSGLKPTKQSNAKSKNSKPFAKPKSIKMSQNKKENTEVIKDRPIIPEIFGNKNKLLATKLKNQQTQKLAQKKKQEKIANDEEIKKKIAQKEAFDEVKAIENENPKIDVTSKIEPKPDVIENKALNQIDDQPEDPILDEEDFDDDQSLDFNETSSTLVLNFNGKFDPEMALYQKYVQIEVERLWKPPLGVPRGTTCRIGFLVDRQGKIKHFEIIKRSNVLIYDLSILRIAHLFKFNRKLWGKNFTIDFCQ